jgi:hypothetical protein
LSRGAGLHGGHSGRSGGGPIRVPRPQLGGGIVGATQRERRVSPESTPHASIGPADFV